MPYRKLPTAEYQTLAARDLYGNFSVRFPGEGRYDFPLVRPYCGPIPDRLIPYNDVTRYARDETQLTAVHCFLTDNRFSRMYTEPAVALTRLLDVGMSLGPDFSTFTNWPRAIQIYNIFRNRWCCALWQAEGLPTIPTVSWMGTGSYGWVFDGLPRQSVVAVSSTGCLRDKAAFALFCRGYLHMVRRLDPDKVLCYGRIPESCRKLAPWREYPLKHTVHCGADGVRGIKST
jgi:hypothetical protein